MSVKKVERWEDSQGRTYKTEMEAVLADREWDFKEAIYAALHLTETVGGTRRFSNRDFCDHEIVQMVQHHARDIKKIFEEYDI